MIGEIGVGTYGHGEAYGGITEEEARDVLKRALRFVPSSAKLFVDTAPRYGCGAVESWIGRLPSSIRERLLITTKGGRHINPGHVNEKDFSREFLESDLQASLARLNADEIFLYQLHNPSLDVIEQGEVFDILEAFRVQGYIKWYGVSINDPEEGMVAMQVCEERGYDGLASLQVIYNVLEKKNRRELFELAKKNGVSIIVREPLHRGFLTGKYDVDEDFISKPPAVAKQAKLYDVNQIFKGMAEFKEIVTKNCPNLSLTQAAIAFSRAPEEVTVTIPGVNRVQYVEEDLCIPNVHVEVTEKLRSLQDLERQ